MEELESVCDIYVFTMGMLWIKFVMINKSYECSIHRNMEQFNMR